MNFILIEHSIQGFTYNGPTLVLADQTWIDNVDILYKPSPNGEGWVTFDPKNDMNDFYTMEDKVTYFAKSDTLNYNIPVQNAAFEGLLVPQIFNLAGSNQFTKLVTEFQLVFRIPHGLNNVPSSCFVAPGNEESTGISYWESDNTFITVYYFLSPPINSTVVLNWSATIMQS
jgi:hypothetical protein